MDNPSDRSVVRQPITERQLEAIHVAYSLTRLAVLPPLTVDATLPAAAQDACLESYFTNLRLCVEFFTRRRDPQDRDFHATDYLPDWSAPNARLDELWEFTSQMVSHLSRRRLPTSDSHVLQSVEPVVLAHHAETVFDIAARFTEQLDARENATQEPRGCAFTFATALQDVGRQIAAD